MDLRIAIILMVVFMVSCSSSTVVNSPAGTPSNDPIPSSPQAALTPEPSPSLACYPNVTTAQQPPVSLDEYKPFNKVEDECFSIYVPQEWEVSHDSMSGFTFTRNKEMIATSEVIGLILTNDTVAHYQLNHSEQLQAVAITPPPITGITVQAYSVQLVFTKPAADSDPDWTDKQTHLLLSIVELERSYAFYFQSDQVDDATIQQIALSFRLKLAS